MGLGTPKTANPNPSHGQNCEPQHLSRANLRTPALMGANLPADLEILENAHRFLKQCKIWGASPLKCKVAPASKGVPENTKTSVSWPGAALGRQGPLGAAKELSASLCNLKFRRGESSSTAGVRQLGRAVLGFAFFCLLAGVRAENCEPQPFPHTKLRTPAWAGTTRRRLQQQTKATPKPRSPSAPRFKSFMSQPWDLEAQTRRDMKPRSPDQGRTKAPQPEPRSPDAARHETAKPKPS